jgi:hypothetical protein
MIRAFLISGGLTELYSLKYLPSATGGRNGGEGTSIHLLIAGRMAGKLS